MQKNLITNTHQDPRLIVVKEDKITLFFFKL
jgi:hypothetical protein